MFGNVSQSLPLVQITVDIDDSNFEFDAFNQCLLQPKMFELHLNIT